MRYDRRKKWLEKVAQCIRVRGDWYYMYLPHGKPRDKDFEWWVGLENRQHQNLQLLLSSTD